MPACQCGGNKVANKLKAEGEPCGADTECETQFCAAPTKQKVCVRKCADGCKENEICENLGTSDNQRFACVANVPGLCGGCQTDVDCPYVGDRCIKLGAENICGRDCSFNGACPSSYTCADGNDALGGAVQKQCQPNSGTCQCTTASAGMTKPCSSTNNLGTCMGVQTCNPPAGYDACSAHVPAPETCDGIDDDCNGMTDENLGTTTCGKGECKRTADNCVNGSPNFCVPGDAGTEICDGKDNDCDGVVDNGFNTATDVNNCGTCGHICVLPHATAICSNSMCAVGLCDPGWFNANGLDSDGCEYSCTLSNGGVEICDGLDNNCNGMIDEGFMLASDPTNCGMCGHVCSVTNGNIMTYACNATQCAIKTCDMGFSDCDQQYATGCEQNTSSDVNNCGGCNTRCMLPNATAGCASSACTIVMCNMGFANCDMQVPDGCEINITNDPANCGGCGNICPVPAHATADCTMAMCTYACLSGYIDLNGQAADGCEYQCTATSGSDVPDFPGFVDANCDGIDGEVANAIFVDQVGGLDTNAGTKALPKKTIQSGINAAAATNPLKAVYVSKGNYGESVVLHDGVSIYGGYDASNGWHRANANVTTINSPTSVGVLGSNLGLSMEVQLFTIVAANASGNQANGDGNSSVAMMFISSSNVTVRGCSLFAGNGTTGAGGPSGTTGGNGGVGGNAGVGVLINPGAGATSTCGAAGGAGGTGVGGVQNGISGSNGASPVGGGIVGPGGNPGGQGSCSTFSASDGQPAPPVSIGGGAGPAGNNGFAGGQIGILSSSGIYACVAGGDGALGNPGGGAGGGGSGGGTAHANDDFVCLDCSPVRSGGGGGGGAGGCGGTQGKGGRGGGGSFGIMSYQSTLVVDTTSFQTGTGGNGGSGGSGGLGGTGGNGGLGVAGERPGSGTFCNDYSGGAGANGAKGGAGGRGGGAAGGSGGPSVCVLFKGSAPTILGTSPCMFGTAGNGGSGGTNGTATAPPGATGATGQSQQAM